MLKDFLTYAEMGMCACNSGCYGYDQTDYEEEMDIILNHEGTWIYYEEDISSEPERYEPLSAHK